MSYRRYRVHTEDPARSSRPDEQSPCERWREAEVGDRQLVRRPTTTTMVRHQDYRDSQHSSDESSDDDRNAGQLVIRQSPNHASQSLIRRPAELRSHNTEPRRSAEPRSYHNESRSHSRREPERPARSNNYHPEPAHLRIYRVGAAPQREPPRHIRGQDSGNADAARLRNISRLEVEVAELEERLRNCGSRSRSGHSSSGHGEYSSRNYQSTNHATIYDEDDHCWCCDGNCGR